MGTDQFAITLPDLRPGERYSGLVLANGVPSHHLILLPGEAECVSWDAAVAWAVEAGGKLPTRRELGLLYTNMEEEFKESWYWSGEQHALNPSAAWGMGFLGCMQYTNAKSYEARARAVRRLKIQ